jgi:hypothetical protein
MPTSGKSVSAVACREQWIGAKNLFELGDEKLHGITV